MCIFVKGSFFLQKVPIVFWKAENLIFVVLAKIQISVRKGRDLLTHIGATSFGFNQGELRDQPSSSFLLLLCYLDMIDHPKCAIVVVTEKL